VLSLLLKIITVAGIWASTQRFAALMGYDPALVGEPFRTLNFRDSALPLYGNATVPVTDFQTHFAG